MPAISCHTPIRHLLVALIVITAIAMAGCSRPSTLQEIRNEGVVHVITRVAPSIYYQQEDSASGYDYQLLRQFAEDLGVELRIRVADDNSEVLSVLSNNYAHIGLSGLTDQQPISEQFRTVPTGIKAQSLVIYNREAPRPRSLEELRGETLHMLADSNHEFLLADTPDAPGPIPKVHPGLDAAGLLARVESGDFSYAVVASNEMELNQVFFPMVKKGFALNEPRELVWLLPKEQDGTLYNALTGFMEKMRGSGALAQIRERFYGHLDRLNYVGARTFMHHVENRLPRYKDLFELYARETSLDWRLLAAIGYQESHWRPNAVSPTGVRGLMMLTQATARHVGINNRLNPEESIEGGARYFIRVRDKIPERIPEPDRTWFALASYNVGFGHLEDARRLAQSAGKDPDRWMDVKEFLPLLAQKEWYSKTRFGYARGYEPVIYVQNIRRYFDVLVRLTESHLPGTAEMDGELAWLETDSPEAEDETLAAKAAPNDLVPSELGPIPPTL
ncbi:membrane-bound lytic murein transglycosylase F [Marinobacter oulmenensis]|uniref:Membrane-bound lytic murein transglycosylase F n=1 Tax=Marinobacter oulmenensis TaxID=643747 RepID=A0A840UKS5_9GAMM|nr:membrane-bound lytic murein transglycosylase MltF [Marinobacter oulmenensis]MBB5322855.1 membrane-bound lytic murein transglycosylase F [Marinobacter oulmenensis]